MSRAVIRTVMHAMRAWWTGLARRERLMSAGAAAFVALVVVFLVAVEPAARARARLADELPRLREQTAEMEAMAQEAKLLKARAVAVESAPAAVAALQQSLPGGSLAGMRIAALDERRLSANAKGIPAAAWFSWLEASAREARLRVVAVRVARTATRGMVDAEATFEIARRP